MASDVYWVLAFVASGIVLWVDGHRRGKAMWSALGLGLVTVLTAGARTAESPLHEFGLWPTLGALVPPLVIQVHVLLTRVKRIAHTNRGEIAMFDVNAMTADTMTPEEKRLIFSVRWATAAVTFWVTLMGVQAVLAFHGYSSAW